MKKIIIVGAGGHGCSVAEAINLKGDYSITGFIDDNYSNTNPKNNIPIIGDMNALNHCLASTNSVVVAIGNNSVRERLYNILIERKFNMVTVVHPKAIISPSAQIGAGCTIMAGAVVGANTILRKGVIVNSGSIIDHDCLIEDFAHLAVNSCMAGGSQLGARSWLHAGASLGYKTIIQADTIITGSALNN